MNADQDRLTVWNLADGKPRLVILGDFHARTLQGDSFLATHAAYIVEEERLVVYALDQEGSRLLDISPDAEHLSAVAVAPDGRSMAYRTTGAGGAYQLVSLPQGEPASLLPAAGGPTECRDALSRCCQLYSPDGRIIATSAGADVALTDARTGKALHFLVRHRDHIEVGSCALIGAGSVSQVRRGR